MERQTIYQCAADLYTLALPKTPYYIPVSPAPEKMGKRSFHNTVHCAFFAPRSPYAKYVTDGLEYIYWRLHAFTRDMCYMSDKSSSNNNRMPDMIQFKLNDAELKQFDEWLEANGTKFDDLVNDMLVEGHKIGISLDMRNNSLITSFTPKDEKNVNAGQCLLSRSDTWQESVMINVFKHKVLFKKRKWEGRADTSERG